MVTGRNKSTPAAVDTANRELDFVRMSRRDVAERDRLAAVSAAEAQIAADAAAAAGGVDANAAAMQALNMVANAAHVVAPAPAPVPAPVPAPAPALHTAHPLYTPFNAQLDLLLDHLTVYMYVRSTGRGKEVKLLTEFDGREYEDRDVKMQVNANLRAMQVLRAFYDSTMRPREAAQMDDGDNDDGESDDEDVDSKADITTRDSKRMRELFDNTRRQSRNVLDKVRRAQQAMSALSEQTETNYRADVVEPLIDSVVGRPWGAMTDQQRNMDKLLSHGLSGLCARVIEQYTHGTPIVSAKNLAYGIEQRRLDKVKDDADAKEQGDAIAAVTERRARDAAFASPVGQWRFNHASWLKNATYTDLEIKILLATSPEDATRQCEEQEYVELINSSKLAFKMQYEADIHSWGAIFSHAIYHEDVNKFDLRRMINRCSVTLLQRDAIRRIMQFYNYAVWLLPLYRAYRFHEQFQADHVTWVSIFTSQPWIDFQAGKIGGAALQASLTPQMKKVIDGVMVRGKLVGGISHFIDREKLILGEYDKWLKAGTAPSSSPIPSSSSSSSSSAAAAARPVRMFASMSDEEKRLAALPYHRPVPHFFGGVSVNPTEQGKRMNQQRWNRIQREYHERYVKKTPELLAERAAEERNVRIYMRKYDSNEKRDAYNAARSTSQIAIPYRCDGVAYTNELQRRNAIQLHLNQFPYDTPLSHDTPLSDRRGPNGTAYIDMRHVVGLPTMEDDGVMDAAAERNHRIYMRKYDTIEKRDAFARAQPTMKQILVAYKRDDRSPAMNTIRRNATIQQHLQQWPYDGVVTRDSDDNDGEDDEGNLHINVLHLDRLPTMDDDGVDDTANPPVSKRNYDDIEANPPVSKRQYVDIKKREKRRQALNREYNEEFANGRIYAAKQAREAVERNHRVYMMRYDTEAKRDAFNLSRPGETVSISYTVPAYTNEADFLRQVKERKEEAIQLRKRRYQYDAHSGKEDDETGFTAGSSVIVKYFPIHHPTGDLPHIQD